MKVFGLSLLIAGSLAAPERDAKFLSIFNIVKFNNDACTAASGGSVLGTCYTAGECTALGGTADGACASSFGVCCTAVVDTCTSSAGNNVRLNNTYINNPRYPLTLANGTVNCTTARQATTNTYAYTITKPTNVAQIRLDFLDVELDAPVAGLCTNGTGIKITGADAVSQNIIPTNNLCGHLTGSHMYLSVADATNVTVTIITGTAGKQKWRILVRFYETGSIYLAPRGCLQYYRQNSGTIQSFNFNPAAAAGTNQLLTDHMYSICIKGVPNFCNVAMTASNFSLSGTAGACTAAVDKIVLGATTYCGATFGTAGSATWTYLGGENYIIPVMTAPTNVNSVGGFQISYLLLPC